MSNTRLHQLYEEQQQAPWLDNISRSMIRSGALQQQIDSGILGVTSNPTIFEKALASGDAYDEAIRAAVNNGSDVADIFFGLMVEDIANAADMFRPIYENTGHEDGFISIEVTPDLAKDTEATIAQARTFAAQLQRPNILVKVPATPEGIPAIEQLIYDGISINVTLIFSLQRYQEVIDAYLKGLERRLDEGKEIAEIRSVASFFISRVDSNIDKRLQKLADATDDQSQQARFKGLMGQAAVANAKMAYQLFLQNFAGPRWEKIAAGGGNYQRPLWASTSTKNPEYLDTLYVDQLIGPHTVNTMPNNTIESFLDHGTVGRTIDQNLDESTRVLQELEALGISMDEVTQELEDEGVSSFAKSYVTLSGSLEAKVKEIGKQEGVAVGGGVLSRS